MMKETNEDRKLSKISVLTHLVGYRGLTRPIVVKTRIGLMKIFNSFVGYIISQTLLTGMCSRTTCSRPRSRPQNFVLEVSSRSRPVQDPIPGIME